MKCFIKWVMVLGFAYPTVLFANDTPLLVFGGYQVIDGEAYPIKTFDRDYYKLKKNTQYMRKVPLELSLQKLLLKRWNYSLDLSGAKHIKSYIDRGMYAHFKKSHTTKVLSNELWRYFLRIGKKDISQARIEQLIRKSLESPIVIIWSFYRPGAKTRYMARRERKDIDKLVNLEVYYASDETKKSLQYDATNVTEFNHFINTNDELSKVMAAMAYHVLDGNHANNFAPRSAATQRHEGLSSYVFYLSEYDHAINTTLPEHVFAIANKQLESSQALVARIEQKEGQELKVSKMGIVAPKDGAFWRYNWSIVKPGGNKSESMSDTINFLRTKSGLYQRKACFSYNMCRMKVYDNSYQIIRNLRFGKSGVWSEHINFLEPKMHQVLVDADKDISSIVSVNPQPKTEIKDQYLNFNFQKLRQLDVLAVGRSDILSAEERKALYVDFGLAYSRCLKDEQIQRYSFEKVKKMGSTTTYRASIEYMTDSLFADRSYSEIVKRAKQADTSQEVAILRLIDTLGCSSPIIGNIRTALLEANF